MSDNAESARVTRGSRKRAREDRKAARAASAWVSQLPFGALINNYPPLSPLTEEQLEVMMKNEQLVIDGEPILGPHGTRALCTALMGNAPGMSGAVFKMAKNFRCDLRVLRCCGAFTLLM